MGEKHPPKKGKNGGYGLFKSVVAA